jgi:myosin heavy subunit
MAQESIVSGLFGLTPQAYERQQYEQSLREGQTFGTPQGLYASAAQLGRGIGSFMGAEDPTLLKITAQDQILKSLDITNPQSIATGIERAQQAGIPELAFKLVAVRDEATARSQAQRGLQLSQYAQQLLPQIKNPDGTINEEVKNQLLSFQQGRTAISEMAKVIPDLRRIGATVGQEENPFSVFINDPTIPANVKTTAQQYSASLKQGILDPEKVDARVKELSEMAQRAQQFQQGQDQLAVFKQQGLENSRQSLALQSQMANLQQQNMQFSQNMKQQELDRKLEDAKKKPLPSYLAKGEEEDFDVATTATNLATDSNTFINRIKSGEIKFGRKDQLSIKAREIIGSDAPDVIARQDFDKFIQRMTSENLRLNKGVQTDKDFEREMKLLKSAESKASAAQIMQNLVDINIRKAKNADESITRRRTNAGFNAPELRIEIPTFEPHIFSDADYSSFLKNPKYKSGTVFIDPEGVRRVKP